MSMQLSEPRPEEEYESFQPYSPLDRKGLFNRPLLPYAIGGGVLLAIVALWAVFRTPSPPAIDSAQLAMLEQRLGELDARVMNLEAASARLSTLEAGARDAAGLTRRLETLEASLARNLNELAQKVEKLEKPAAPKASAPAAKSTPAKAPAPAKTHVVKAGETLYQISRQYNLKVEDLLRLNGWKSIPTIQPGQSIVVSRGGA